MARCLVVFSTVAVAVAIAGHAVAGSRYLYFKVKSPVARGQLAHVVVQGRTGLCRITVSKGGAEMQFGHRAAVNPLAPRLSKPADDNRVAWQWHVPAKTPLGQWQVRVTCGSAATLRGAFLVTG
jgi:hypothetical protein